MPSCLPTDPFGRRLKFDHFQELLAPLVADCMATTGDTFEVITLLGLQCRLLADMKKEEKPLFVYENCAFCVHEGYTTLDSLQMWGMRLVPKIFQDVTKSHLSRGGFPKLHLVRNPASRTEVAKMYLQATEEFHRSNAPAVMWCQGLAWASLSFLEWIDMDRCFPLVYCLSTAFSNGKSSAMNALALSIGLSPESMGGNKTSESGFLDWTNSCCGMAYFLDDFNAKSVNHSREQNTWKELFKQLHDANSVNQHGKFRLVLSAIFLSANTELCPWDGPLQSRLFTAVFTAQEPADVQVADTYNSVMRLTSCLVPDIVGWRYKKQLDRKYISELQVFLERIGHELCLPRRIFQHLKKPMYYLCLMFRLLGATPELYDRYIFDHVKLCVLPRYKQYCGQSDMWKKFFFYFEGTIQSCNRRSSDPTQSLHWCVNSITTASSSCSISLLLSLPLRVYSDAVSDSAIPTSSSSTFSNIAATFASTCSTLCISAISTLCTCIICMSVAGITV